MRAGLERVATGVAFLATLASFLLYVVVAVSGSQQNLEILPYTAVLTGLLGTLLWNISHAERSSPRVQRRIHVLTSITCVVAAAAVSHDASERSGDQIMLALLLIMFWTASMVPWRLMLGLSSACFVIPYLSGATVALTYQTNTAPGSINGASLFVVCFLPVGVSTAIQRGYDVLQHNYDETVERVHHRVRSLEETIQARTDAFFRSQEQLFRAQKMRTTGTLAAGLAHELNNILTPARGFAELLVDQHGSEQARHYAGRILDATIASTRITRALLTYTKQTPFTPQNTDLRMFLRTQVSPMILQIVPNHSVLELQCPRGIFVSIDRLMMQQSITNLVLNAVDATEAGGTIRIVVETTDGPISAEQVAPETLRKNATEVDAEAAGALAIIRVIDNGAGIPEASMEQIFDPFFTTRPHGTGLGLPTVQGIVERHGGLISVRSSGEGTCISILLPMQSRQMAADGEMQSLGAVDELRALVLTDDDDLRDELEALLEEASLEVTARAHPGLGEYDDITPHRFDVIIQDLGEIVMDADRRDASLVPRILLTERPNDPSVLRGTLGNHVHRLKKPLDADHFRSVLHTALSSTHGP